METNFWNKRYSENELVYGDEPNQFFKQQLAQLPAGKLLLPAEGEGRNALFAAKQGWSVDAFDFSEVARQKALTAAAKNNVNINYSIEDIRHIKLPVNTYDVVALIYVHLPPDVRSAFHRQVVRALKTGGHLIVEVFSKKQIGNTSGGPKDENLLHDIATLREDFKDLDIIIARSEDILLDEGSFHRGLAAVVRVVAKKI